MRDLSFRLFSMSAFGRSEEQIVKDAIDQVNALFPSSKKLKCTWSSVVKLGQSLYREKPGQDKFRPTQATPIPNFFLAGSYTYQDYLDSMEGATRSGLMVADEVIARADGPNGLKAMSIKAKEEAAKEESVEEETEPEVATVEETEPEKEKALFFASE